MRPVVFPGSDIGELAVNGTVNDLAVSGARPLALSAGFVIEEGFPVADLRRISASMAAAAEAAGVSIATADTKVVERGNADGRSTWRATRRPCTSWPRRCSSSAAAPCAGCATRPAVGWRRH